MAVAGAECAGPRVAARRDLVGFGYLAAMILIGSTTATAAKFAVRELPAALLPLVRFGGAGLCLLPIAWRGGGLARLARADGWRLLATAALCVPINQAFFLNGAKLTTSAHIGLIYAACPLVVLALACVLGQERLTRGRLAGVLASVAGVAIIGLGGLRQSGSAGAGVLWGDLLEIGAVISWGAYLTVNKPLVARHGAVTTLVGTFLAGALLQLPVALLAMPAWPSLGAASPAAWRGLAFLTLIVSVFGLTFQNQALRRFDASQVAAVGNLAPLLTVAWGGLLLGEEVTPTLLLGGALTMGGVVWAASGRREVAPAP